jgi:hypothetical protein
MIAELPWAVEHKSRNVLAVEYDIDSTVNWERWVFLSADRHFDHAHSDWAMQRRHLAECAERHALIVDAGDMLCLMQGKGDRRSKKYELHPKIEARINRDKTQYLNAVLDEAGDFYGPYAHLFGVIGRGNHEQKYTDTHEVDVTDELVNCRLNHEPGARIQAGGYGGWVWFKFRRGQQRMSRRLYYYHGKGGGGISSKGVTHSTQRQTYITADYVLSGHTHEAYIVEIPRVELNDAGAQVQRTTYHVQTPSYKDSFGDGYDGWENETGKPPKPMGGWWLRFYWDGSRGLREQFIRAS